MDYHALEFTHLNQQWRNIVKKYLSFWNLLFVVLVLFAIYRWLPSIQNWWNYREPPTWTAVTEYIIQPVDACSNPLALVNRWNKLPVTECEIPNLVNIQENGIWAAEGLLLRREVIPQVSDLMTEASVAGFELKIIAAHRTCEQQNEVYSRWRWQALGSRNYADAYSYECGFSSHHLGTTIDVVEGDAGNIDLEFDSTPEYQWLVENAHKFGCVHEYPEGKEEITGLNFEPWHLRCGLGPALAGNLVESGTTLTEWLNNK